MKVLKAKGIVYQFYLKTVFRPSEEELAELLHEVDEDGSGEIEFGELRVLEMLQFCENIWVSNILGLYFAI